MSTTKIVGVYVTVTLLEGDRDLDWELNVGKGLVGQKFDSPSQAFSAIIKPVSDAITETVGVIDRYAALAADAVSKYEQKYEETRKERTN